MKDHGVSAVKVATLKYDASDIKARQKQPHVIELAASIRATGGRLINPITIQKRTRVLLAGRDRLAAVLLNQSSTVDAHQVEADAKEAARIERHENLHRRPVDRDRLIAEEVAEAAKTIDTAKAAAKADPPPKAEKPDKLSGKSPKAPKAEPAPKGRPKSSKGEAREQLAKKLGTTPEAVRKSEQRATKADTPPAVKAGPKSLPNWGVETFGVLVSDDFAEAIGVIIRGLDATDRHLKAAQAAVTKLELEIVVGDIETGALPRIKQLLHDAASAARALHPKMVCAYCKDPDDEAGRREKCKGCDNRGYLSEGRAQGVPPELTIKGEHAMVSDGKTGFVALGK